MRWETNTASNKFHYLLRPRLPHLTLVLKMNLNNLNIVNSARYKRIIELILWLELANSVAGRVFLLIEVGKGNPNKVFRKKKSPFEGEAHFHRMCD